MIAATPSYMLDTVAFNRFLDSELNPASFRGRRLLATGVQLGELGATTNAERRARLLAVFEAVDPLMEAAASFTFGIEGAGWGQAYWNDGTGNFDRMLRRLRELDSAKKTRVKDPRKNQICDVLIAETAVKTGAILVTDDRNLLAVVTEFGGEAVEFDRFVRGEPDPGA
jgi:hypothetical protein